MTVFVDSTAWYAAADKDDVHNRRARELITSERPQVTTDYVVAETWRLMRVRLGFDTAERFLEESTDGTWPVERVTAPDVVKALDIGRGFRDQRFSLVVRTSFAVMERLGVSRAIAFDDDFVVYRFGPDLRRAFEVIR